MTDRMFNDSSEALCYAHGLADAIELVGEWAGQDWLQGRQEQADTLKNLYHVLKQHHEQAEKRERELRRSEIEAPREAVGLPERAG
jgi:hypothetical protein